MFPCMNEEIRSIVHVLHQVIGNVAITRARHMDGRQVQWQTRDGSFVNDMSTAQHQHAIQQSKALRGWLMQCAQDCAIVFFAHAFQNAQQLIRAYHVCTYE